MRDKKYYEHEAIWQIPAFGISAFNIPQAAEFVAKILCLEGYLDKSVPDEEDQYCLDNPILPSMLCEEIKEYEAAIISGVEKGTLKALHISRDISDNIDGNKTYVDIDILHDWFQKRGIEISGDFYAEYLDKICEVYDAAIEAIVIKEDKIRRKIKDDIGSPERQKIFLLKRKIDDLESKLFVDSVSEKLLETRERQTLLKMVIGMAIDGYGYDPKANKSPVPKEIADALILKGIAVSDDTVRKRLNEGKELLPPDFDSDR